MLKHSVLWGEPAARVLPPVPVVFVLWYGWYITHLSSGGEGTSFHFPAWILPYPPLCLLVVGEGGEGSLYMYVQHVRTLFSM